SVSDAEFPHGSLSLNSASGSDLLSLFSSWSKTAFDLKRCFLDAMDFSRQKEQLKCRQGTGQSTRDKMYVKCFETVMFYYVIFVY
ncbi:unnamed protein product, partial [Staurois parvus]